MTAHTKTVTRAKVMAHVAGVLQGGLPDAAALEELTDHVLAHELGVALPESASHFTHADRYTSVDLVEAEHAITEAATRRLGDGSGVVDAERAKKALTFWQRKKGFRPSPEQARTIVRLVRAGHGIDMVQGVAGAGKTTIMSAARTAWEAGGLRVEGAAVAAVAASGLRTEAGINSRTVAAWRRRIEDGPGLAGVDVLVLDESAMVADRDLAALVLEADRTGTKLVGIGDSQQLRAVGAGGAFARVHELVGGETLTENRRQRHEVDRTALETWRKGGRHTALALWGEHGLIRAPADLETAYGQMAAAWWNDRQAFPDNPHEATEKLLLLAATNRDVDELNTRARAIARTEGLLTSPDTHFHVRGGERLALAAGDQVRVRENDYRSHRGPDQVDVLNGFRGVVLEVDSRRGAH
ncbi:AAA family ATPase, partial [Brevundimonas sp. NPDC055320]